MIALLAVLLAAEAQAAPASAVLPAVPGATQYGAPASLPPVTAQLFSIGGKNEVQPMFAFSVGDPFWRTLGMGLRLEHHFDERWSVSAHGLGAVSLLAAPVDVCDASCSSPNAGALRSTPGKLQLLAGAEVGWAPVYGKLSLFGERTLHFDAYIAAGPELVREIIAPDAASAAVGRWGVGGRFSLGERLFITDKFMIRLAASELVWPSKVRGLSEVERKLSFEGGVAWLFGGR